MLMNIPVHCLEGLLVSRVDEQQMRWLTEWIAKLLLMLLLELRLRRSQLVKHTVVLDEADASPRP